MNRATVGAALAALVIMTVRAPALADRASAEAHIKQGLSHQEQFQFSQAISAYDRALREDAWNIGALANRGHCRQSLGDPAGAVDDYTRALTARPDDAGLLLNRGLCRLDLRQYEPARQDFDRAVGLDPKRGLGWLGRGIARHHLGDAAGARADVSKALKIDPRCKFELLRREVVATEATRQTRASAFLGELQGENDPELRRERAELRRFNAIMGGGYWDLDGRYKFYSPE